MICKREPNKLDLLRLYYRTTGLPKGQKGGSSLVLGNGVAIVTVNCYGARSASNNTCVGNEAEREVQQPSSSSEPGRLETGIQKLMALEMLSRNQKGLDV